MAVMTASLNHLLTHQHILLLQGKMGTFFSRFAGFLMRQGKQVSKVNFNAGDAFFYQHDAVYDYQDDLKAFSGWLTHLLQQQKIDAVVCFGDCRPHHAQASMVCQNLGIAFFVFEEGYLRPDYITLQEHGINAYSKLDLSPISSLKPAHDEPLYTHNRFYRLVLASMIYYILTQANQEKFPHYHHYRDLTAWQEAKAWLKAPYRKLLGYSADKKLQETLVAHSEQYFLVSLQVYNDSQITHHSDYQDVTEFIDEVIKSFAQYAHFEAWLVFKHHPLDRGHRNYASLIHQLAKRYGVVGRVFYGCDMHLPTLIKHSIGMITINSTTGLQSIYHQKPTKVMGRALYDIEGLCDQKPLSEFWRCPQPPNQQFYLKFRRYLIEQTQLNGSFYGKSPWMNEFE